MRLISFLLLFLLGQSMFAQLPANMFADSAHAPFLHGVASFEPLPDGIVLWTRLDPGSQVVGSVSFNWEVASDSMFSNVISSGVTGSDSSRDWTAAISVQGLAADTYYWYRFERNGNYSATGRTRTAPAGSVSRAKFGVVSCSSIYSGFFNGYRRIGERDDLNLLIHLGDYIYDFVDPDEEIRVPAPYPSVPGSLSEWRERHKYYLLDPDLRYARQQHPWVVIWDNHDMDNDSVVRLNAIQAFQEYVPIRLADSNRTDIIYRNYSFGDLVEVIMMDILVFRDVDNVPGAGPSILGNAQFAWLDQTLQASTAKWRILGSQNMMSTWSSSNLPSWFPFGNGQVFDPSSWDGYGDDRDRVMDVLIQNQIGNNIVISGDAHLSQASDLCKDPFDPQLYDPNTGVGAVGVEFLPTSISRGNLDEMGFGGILAAIATTASLAGNPHHQYSEFTEHGYGIIDVRPDSALAQYWYTPILNQSSSQSMGAELIVRDGENHWSRGPLTGSVEAATPEMELSAFPNPSQEEIKLNITAVSSGKYRIHLSDALGKKLSEPLSAQLATKQKREFVIKIPDGVAAGILFVSVEGPEGIWSKKILYQP